MNQEPTWLVVGSAILLFVAVGVAVYICALGVFVKTERSETDAISQQEAVEMGLCN